MAGQVLSKKSCKKFKHLWFLSWKLVTFRHFEPSRESLCARRKQTEHEITYRLCPIRIFFRDNGTKFPY